MNATSGYVSPAQGFYHGAHLVFVDGLGCGSSLDASKLKEDAVKYLLYLLKLSGCTVPEIDGPREITSDSKVLGIAPFFINKGIYIIVIILLNFNNQLNLLY